MNITRNTLLLAVAAAGFATLATPARAQEAVYELPQPAVSAKTRAEVRAELLQARVQGTLLATEADFQKQPVFVAGKSRATVANEVLADAGASRMLAAEPHGFDVPRATQRQGSVRLIASAAR